MLVHLSQEQGHHCEEKERVEEYTTDLRNMWSDF